MTSRFSFLFDRDGLIPVVTQDAASGEVLMLAYMNEQALQRTLETRLVHYWSRSRNTLWLKGETSGNSQNLVSIHVNCEQNSLLIKAIQQGAVCHNGFDTCFYRSLQPDGTLHLERDRVFDPVHVYENAGSERRVGSDPIRTQFDAYVYLRDQDLTGFSSTSRRLRTPELATLKRVADELSELAGVLAGEHIHQDRKSDLILESSQVMYWVYVATLGTGQTWQQIRPDVALATSSLVASHDTLQALIRQYVAKWTEASRYGLHDGALAHATLALIAQVCHAENIDPVSIVEFDLNELRGRSYLNDFFSLRLSR